MYKNHIDLIGSVGSDPEACHTSNGTAAEGAARLAQGAYIEVEGELRHRSYQKEVQAGRKAVAVYIPVTEIHAHVLRKLDRSNTPAESEVIDDAPE